MRFAEQTVTPTRDVVETATQTVGDTTTTLSFSTSSLTADTEYEVQAIATAEVGVQEDTEFSDTTLATTNQQ